VNNEAIYDFEEKIFELENELEAKHQETRDLANIASVITSILDIESVLAVTMEISIRQMSGEVGAILLLENGDLVVKISWGVDGIIISNLIYKDGLDIAQYCLNKQTSIYENDGSSISSCGIDLRSFIASPIPSKEESIGVIVIFNKEGGLDFNDNDRQNLDLICKFASVAIENINLLEEHLEKQKIEQELELAREVQTTFLPEIVEIEGLRIAANYIPARQVSGDYYDLIRIGKDKLFFLVGDVTSKGAPAALVMTSVYSIIRAYVISGQVIDVKKIMSHLNDLLCNDIIKGREMFITLFMAYLDMGTRTMEYCNGGHPAPLYYRLASRDTIPLKQGGPLVGQFAGIPYRSTRVKVNPGDRIFCYTDGFIEAENRKGELYGQSRLKQFFAAGIMFDTERFNRVILEELDRFRQGGSTEAIDDLTTLVIDFTSDSASRMYDFTYQSSLDSLKQLYQDLDGIYKENRLKPAVSEPFTLALSEAITNAIVHAHNYNRAKKIQLSIELNRSRITADINDEGDCRDIDLIRARDLKFDPSKESGRGLGLIKRLTDEVDFRKTPQGGMGIKITKFLT
jgi:sigma-B regulation protein RsbU (phosphoserine phosphatase)